MYQQHFGFRKPIFDLRMAQDGTVLAADAQIEALRHAGIALTSRDSAVVLCGATGIGKTTFATAAIRQACGSARFASAWLSTPPLSAYEMLELLLLDFGFDPYKHTRVERLQIWRQFLMELGATDTRVFVAVERAEDVAADVLKALAALTAADPNGCPGANMVLMGQERLIEMLDSPTLGELKQRVRMVRRFEPLDDAAVEAYLRHCTAVAGADFDAVFLAETVPALRRYAGGIPRVINHLCETALALAAAQALTRVNAAAVRQAAVEICGMSAADDDLPGHAFGTPQVSTTVAGPTEFAANFVMVSAVTEVAFTAADDQIPVLTESVEIDVDSGCYPIVAAAGDPTTVTHDLVPPARSVVPVERVEPTLDPNDPGDLDDLDELSAELAEAILSADGPDVALPARRNAEADVHADSAADANAEAGPGVNVKLDADADSVAGDQNEVAGEDEARSPLFAALRASVA